MLKKVKQLIKTSDNFIDEFVGSSKVLLYLYFLIAFLTGFIASFLLTGGILEIYSKRISIQKSKPVQQPSISITLIISFLIYFIIIFLIFWQ